MADFRPIRALRYDARRVGALESVIAPSADAQDARTYAMRMAESQWHYGHLDPCRHGLGKQLRAADFADAARRLRAWVQDGALRHDPDPSYYLVEERFEADGVPCRRISITGALRLHAYAEGIVLRHERTLDGPKEDRLMLRRATQAQLSPIFLLFHDANATLQRLHSEVSSLAPDVEVTTEDGVTHALWVLSSPEHVQPLREMVQAQSLWIADGHHRYETALAHQEESRATAVGGEQSTDFQLATLCAMDDPGLVLRPFHRWITFPTAADQMTFVDALRDHSSTDLLDGSVEQWTERLGEAHARGPALVVVATIEERTLAWLVRPPLKTTPWSGEPQALRWLHDELLPGVAGLPLRDQARGHRIRYSPELHEVLRWNADATVPSIAVLVPTYAVDAIAEACRDGEPLPQKSTFFAPKPASGLVMLDLELPPPF